MTVQNPAAYPLPAATTSGTTITVDMLTKSPTVMIAQVQALVASNQGYFAQRLLSMPGMSVEGGAILYQEFFAQDLFLDPAQDLAPRAEGAESPLVGSKRRPWLSALPQSLAGKIEVTDGARKRNQVIAVQQDFTRLANSFTDKLQTWTMDAINTFITGLSGSRSIAGTGWRQARTSGMVNIDPLTTPFLDLGKVTRQFVADKSGIRPDTLVLHQNDAMYLKVLYPKSWKQMLDDAGLTLIETPMQTEGTALFAKSGELGAIAYEKALEMEQGRGPTGTWKDVYAFEAKPVFVVNNAAAFVLVTGINATS